MKEILDFTCDVERLENGNTLITDAGDEQGKGSEIIEVDIKGNIVWSYDNDLNFAHSAKLLSDNTILITDTLNNRVIKVDREKNMTFSSDSWGNNTGYLSDGSHLSYPNDAHEIDECKILISDRNNNRCIITDYNGNILWKYENIKHPHNADMIENGNILIADSDNDRVIEVNQNNEIVWSYGSKETKELSFPRDVDRLENGNTLITDSRHHRIIEISPEGEIVWEYVVDYYASFYEADRLENGNTLISDQHHHQVIEVDNFGNIIWRFHNRVETKTIRPKLYNGFLKKRDENNFPEGWMLYSRFAEGGGSFIFEDESCGLSFDRHGALCLVQYIGVVEGDEYTLIGKMKTKEIEEDAFACFQPFFLDAEGAPICNTSDALKTDMLNGTNEWTEQSLSFVVPKNAKNLELRIIINGKGKVFFKDLMLFR